jgi:hypothetical protein
LKNLIYNKINNNNLINDQIDNLKIKNGKLEDLIQSKDEEIEKLTLGCNLCEHNILTSQMFKLDCTCGTANNH